MQNRLPKRIVIKEDTGGYAPVTYFTSLIIKKNSISYQEETEGDSMFFAERDYSYKYKIESSLFEIRFNELARAIEKVVEEINSGKRLVLHCTDVGINEITVYYEDGKKLKLEFYRSLYENEYIEVANIIRSMIPNCEQISEYLMTPDELKEMYDPDLDDNSDE